MLDKEGIETYLKALNEQLEAIGYPSIEIVVCGGSALNVLDLNERVTRDIDVLAFVSNDGERPQLVAAYFDERFSEAAEKVARDFRLPKDWINNGPTEQVKSGLPAGLYERLETRVYGDNLTAHFTSRFDLIHLKLYAAVDRAGDHLEDLIKLEPGTFGIESAAARCLTQDVSPAFKGELLGLLEHLGYGNLSDRL